MARAADRVRARRALGVLVAALPLALNWRAVDRARGERRAARARRRRCSGARRSLRAAPSGDNDTFLLWYASIAERDGPDVAVLLWGFLYRDWYRAQLGGAIRCGASATEPLQDLADGSAAHRRRRLRFTFSVRAATRAMAGGPWMLRGLTFVPADSSAIRVAAAGRSWTRWRRAEFVARIGRPASRRRTRSTVRRGCGWGCRLPGGVPERARSGARADSLDSRCNLR